MAFRAERARLLAGAAFGLSILTLAGLCVTHPGWVPVLGPVGAGTLLTGIVVQHRLGVRARRWKVGADAERTVAACLTRLDGRWRTLHGVSTGRGDLDHLVVGPTGVFVIETKSHRDLGRVPDHMLAQARRGAVWAGRRLRCQAVPVVCLTRTRVHAPSLVDGVWIVNPDHLPGFVRGAEPLSARDAGRVMRRAARL